MKSSFIPCIPYAINCVENDRSYEHFALHGATVVKDHPQIFQRTDRQVLFQHTRQPVPQILCVPTS